MNKFSDCKMLYILNNELSHDFKDDLRFIDENVSSLDYLLGLVQ